MSKRTTEAQNGPAPSNEDLGATPEWAKNDATRRRWETTRRFELTMSRCEEAARNSRRDTSFDIECGFNVWLHEDHAYLIPIGEEWIKRVIAVPFAEDHSYWNNTDRPKDLSEFEWENRRRLWDRVNCGSGRASHNARRLYHAVVDLRLGASWGFRDMVLTHQPTPTGQE